MQACAIWLLENTVERFSRWWQKAVWSDHDCFWWARVCARVFVYLPLSVMGIIIFLERSVGSGFVGIFVFTFMFINFAIVLGFFGWMMMFFIKEQEEATRRAQYNGLANPAKNNAILLFGVLFASTYIPILIFGALFNPATALISIWLISCLLVIPFSLCDPVPQGMDRSKLQNFIEGLRFARPCTVKVGV